MQETCVVTLYDGSVLVARRTAQEMFEVSFDGDTFYIPLLGGGMATVDAYEIYSIEDYTRRPPLVAVPPVSPSRRAAADLRDRASMEITDMRFQQDQMFDASFGDDDANGHAFDVDNEEDDDDAGSDDFAPESR